MTTPARTTCPFPPCRADVEIINEASGVRRFARHEADTEIRYGGCPASLMETPLSDEAVALLGEQYAVYRMMARRAGRSTAPKPVETTPPPTGSTRWFRNSQGEGAGPSYPENHPGNRPKPPTMPPPATPPTDRRRTPPAEPGVPLGGRPMSDSHMSEAADANAAGMELAERTRGLLAVAREQCEHTYGLFAQSHQGSQQTGSAQAMELVQATMERIDEAHAAISEAILQAQSVQF